MCVEPPITQVCRTDVKKRSQFIRCIYSLLEAESSAVRYDAATTLLTLSTAPTAVAAAAKCYIDLIMRESDNSVKLIVLDRLAGIRRNPNFARILQNMVMDILQVRGRKSKSLFCSPFCALFSSLLGVFFCCFFSPCAFLASYFFLGVVFSRCKLVQWHCFATVVSSHDRCCCCCCCC